jgi:hypothetical protein
MVGPSENVAWTTSTVKVVERSWPTRASVQRKRPRQRLDQTDRADDEGHGQDDR